MTDDLEPVEAVIQWKKFKSEEIHILINQFESKLLFQELPDRFQYSMIIVFGSFL